LGILFKEEITSILGEDRQINLLLGENLKKLEEKDQFEISHKQLLSINNKIK